MSVLLAVSLVAGACSGSKVKAVGKKSTAELLDDLANGSDDGVRVRAVVELGKRHDPVATAALIVAIKDESERVKIERGIRTWSVQGSQRGERVV